MTEDWKAAAQKYEEAKKRGLTTKKDQESQMDAAIKELKEFLKSDKGQDAISLLRASGRKIIFFQSGDELERHVFAFTDNGGQILSERYRGKQKIPIDELVWAAVKDGGISPEEIVNWFMGEFDKIAQAAPK